MKRKVSFPVPKDIVEKLIKTCSSRSKCECCLEEIPNIYKCGMCDKTISIHETCDVEYLKCIDCSKTLCNECVKLKLCGKPVVYTDRYHWDSYWDKCKNVFKRCPDCEPHYRCEKCDVEACSHCDFSGLSGSFIVTHKCNDEISGWYAGILGFISQEDANKL